MRGGIPSHKGWEGRLTETSFLWQTVMVGFNIACLKTLYVSSYVKQRKTKKKENFMSLFVPCRVHVRRTDKVGTEAAFHPIEEYMVHVEEQFQLLARRVHVDKKRVYLATDDPSLLQEAKTKSVTLSSPPSSPIHPSIPVNATFRPSFSTPPLSLSFRYPDYEFISDNSISWSAGLHNRYTENSLRGVILDIHFLSQTDFLVCTFSSQVSSLTDAPAAKNRWRYFCA